MDLLERHIQQIRDAKFTNVPVDASADCNVRDLVAVYVRHTVQGRHTNTFVAVEELKHCHAEGYVDAINKGIIINNAGFNDWFQSSLLLFFHVSPLLDYNCLHTNGLLIVCVLAMEGIRLGDWEGRTVGFGSDGTAVMVGCRSGMATPLRVDVLWLVNIQCLAHGLELAAVDAIKANDAMKKEDMLLHGLYK